MSFAHEVEIRWADLDGFGHASHRAYLDFLEEARNALLDDLVGPEHRRTFTIRRLAVDYLAQLTQADDRARVTIRIEALGDEGLTTAEEVASARDGRVAATATCVLDGGSDAARAQLRERVAAMPQQG